MAFRSRNLFISNREPRDDLFLVNEADVEYNIAQEPWDPYVEKNLESSFLLWPTATEDTMTKFFLVKVFKFDPSIKFQQGKELVI